MNVNSLAVASLAVLLAHLPPAAADVVEFGPEISSFSYRESSMKETGWFHGVYGR